MDNVATKIEETAVKYEKALALVREQFYPGERELMAIPGTLKNPGTNINPGALVITDRRLLFVGSLLLEKSSVSIPVGGVTSVHTRGAYTLVSTAGISHRFMKLPAHFLGYLEEVRTWAQRPATPITPSLNIAEQLAQLSSLHTSGALSPEEFTTAKLRLLSA